jgi:hypothetical protein
MNVDLYTSKIKKPTEKPNFDTIGSIPKDLS